MWIITLLIIIGGLTYIYSQSNKEEGSIIFKLIGYTFLGAFLFRFNEFPIPLGFLVFLIFFRPKINEVAKKRAAYLGIFVLLIGIISPIVSNYLFERPVRVVASSSNLYMLEAEEDWQRIQEKLGYPTRLKIENYNVDYEKDGNIIRFSYNLVGYLGNDMVVYRIELIPDKQVYLINAIKVDQWLQYDRLVFADEFFQALEKINLKEVINQGEKLKYYVVASRGEYMIGSLANDINFLFKDDEMVRIDTSDLPISGFYISLFGMRETSTNSHSSDRYIYYWFQ